MILLPHKPTLAPNMYSAVEELEMLAYWHIPNNAPEVMFSPLRFSKQLDIKLILVITF